MADTLKVLFDDVKAIFDISGRDLFNIVISLLLAFIIGVIIAQVYKRTQRGLNHEMTLMSSLVILAPSVALVMLFIRGDLILSLGLIGSLSIIRFRTAIKDTRDMVFLFWSIVVGLGAGTYNWTAVTIGSILILMFIAILYFVKFGKSKNLDYVLVLNCQSQASLVDTQNVIQPYVHHSNIRSQEIQNDIMEIVLELEFLDTNAETFDKLTKELYALEGIKSVSLLAPQLPIPA